MPSKLKITLTCADYEITRPLKEGRVEADGIDLTMLCATSSRDRHWRLDRNAECDAGEFNLCGYYMARDRGHPYVALPIFLHRRFRHGFLFVNAAKGIAKASQLKGGKFGCSGGMLAAACTWLRGTLGEHYGLSHKDVEVVHRSAARYSFRQQEGFNIEIIEDGPSVEERLLSGEIDAMMSAGLSALAAAPATSGSRGSFPTISRPRSSITSKTKIFPIMHTLIIKEEIDREKSVGPGKSRLCIQRVQEDRAAASARIRASCRSRSILEQHGRANRVLGRDPWQYGLNDINRNNVATALKYTYEQGLIGKPHGRRDIPPIDDWAWTGTEGV